jgi:hypothetical protein
VTKKTVLDSRSGSCERVLFHRSNCIDFEAFRKRVLGDSDPKETREKARAAKDHFDNLYLIVDQQHRWKGALLPDPRPRALDPLLIGELKRGRCSKFILIHQFDLTEAEQYLADEFTTKPDGTFVPNPTDES